ncbi:MAG: hypothetical protein ACLQSX_06050 [Smithella sp.]
MENIQNVIDQARQACKARKIADTQKEDDFEADETRPLIPEGSYQVCCIRIEKAASHFRSLKMFLIFKIVTPGQYMDTELFMAMNLINTKTGKPFKKVPRGSKYFEQWVIANNNIHPRRKDRMSSTIFKNSVFEAIVRTVKPKFPDGTEKPECFHYSVVDYLKGKVT